MRILHIADLHFDRSFEGIADFPEWLSGTIETANEKVWQRIVEIAMKEQIDLVLLAGDTFHQSHSSLKMQRVFFDGLQALATEGIQTVINFGNHDYYQGNRFWFPFPEAVHLFTEEAVTTKVLNVKGQRVAISSFSYTQPWIQARKDLEFPPRMEADYHIGMYHGEQGLNNRYAPFQTSELQKKGYDYWALGHIHKGESLFERAYYAGTPQGHSIKERENTGILLVELNDSQIAVERLAVAEIEWRQVTFSLASIQHVSEIQASVKAQLEMSEASQLVRLVLTDYQHLPELAERVASGEIIALLNSGLSQHFIFQVGLAADEKGQEIAIAPALLEQSLRIYENKEIFNEVVNDLLVQPELGKLLAESDFQQQVLDETKKLIENQETS